MIEIDVVSYLNETLRETPAFMERPERQESKRFVLIEKTAGGELNFIKSATIAIQSYAEDLLEAAKLNEEVKEAMREIVTMPNISKASLNSDYNFTDASTKEYRYQAVYNIIYH